MISEFAYKSNEYILNSEGGTCEQSEDNLEEDNSTNSTLRALEESGNLTIEVTDYSEYYEYFLILPNPFVEED